MSQTLRVLSVVEGTAVDGPGLRTSIYFAGCEHHCPACHNQESWDKDGGTEMTIDELLERIADAGWNVTFSGGDPMLQVEGVTELARRIHDELHLTIWCYTGYTWEQVNASPRLRQLLPWIDVLVDGPYIDAQRDLSLLFRGSGNQRLIDVKTGKEYSPDL